MLSHLTVAVQCSDHDVDMSDSTRQSLMDAAARTPRHGLDVHLYPHTYYGFFVRGDQRNRDERDRCGHLTTSAQTTSCRDCRMTPSLVLQCDPAEQGVGSTGGSGRVNRLRGLSV